MTKLCTVADTQISHVDGINIVKELVQTLIKTNDAELTHDH